MQFRKKINFFFGLNWTILHLSFLPTDPTVFEILASAKTVEVSLHAKSRKQKVLKQLFAVKSTSSLVSCQKALLVCIHTCKVKILDYVICILLFYPVACDVISSEASYVFVCMGRILLRKPNKSLTNVTHGWKQGKIFIFVQRLSPCSFSALPLFKWPWAPAPLKAPSRMLSHQAVCLEATGEVTLKCMWSGALKHRKTELNKEKRGEKATEHRKKRSKRVKMICF